MPHLMNGEIALCRDREHDNNTSILVNCLCFNTSYIFNIITLYSIVVSKNQLSFFFFWVGCKITSLKNELIKQFGGMYGYSICILAII